MNKLEQKLIVELTALPNVRWRHRNIARQGFAINGFIKHYRPTPHSYYYDTTRPTSHSQSSKSFDSHHKHHNTNTAYKNIQ